MNNIEKMRARLNKKIVKFESHKKDEEEKTKLQKQRQILQQKKAEISRIQKEKAKLSKKINENLHLEVKEDETIEFVEDLGIYDRRSILKSIYEKFNTPDREQFEKIKNPPEKVISIRYKKILKELLFSLFFTLIIGFYHLLKYKEIEVNNILNYSIIGILTFISLFFFESSYRKEKVENFIRGSEFVFVIVFLLFFTTNRYIAEKYISLILPGTALFIVSYYIIKVITIEKIMRTKYLFSLSDVNMMKEPILRGSYPEELGMLYQKTPMYERVESLEKHIKDVEEKEKEKKKKSEEKIKENLEELYSENKGKKRNKKEQMNFEKMKAKIK